MKRKMSFFLSIIMALNIVLPFFPPVTIQAAAITGFDVIFDATLLRGPTDTNPVLQQDTDVAEDEALLRWNIAGVSTGRFELDYIIDINQKVKFSVAKNTDGTATVSYELTDDNGVQLPNVATLNAGWSVWDGDTDLWTPINTFRTSFTGQANQYQLLPPNPTNPANPQFLISAGRGFSFNYNGREVMFRWDGSYMYYLTDGFAKGNIYDLTLSYSDGLSAVERAERKVLTGINDDTFRSIPVANVNNTYEGFFDPNKGTVYDGDLTSGTTAAAQLDTNRLQMSNQTEKEENIPAKGLSDLILRFDLPRAYDADANAFTEIPTEDVEAVITLTRADGRGEQDVTIDNVFNITNNNQLVLGGALNTTDATAAARKELELINGGRVHIRIPGIESGVLYSGARFSLGTTAYNSPGDTDLGFNKVYTFMNYNIVPENNGYTLVVKPYGYPGDYTVSVGTGRTGGLEEAAMQHSDGTDAELRFPLTLGTDPRSYQVTFAPLAETGSSISEDTPVYSQIVVYYPEELDSSIISPKDFEVLPPTLIPDRQPAEPADLTFTARWSIASGDMLQKLIDAASGREITIQYNMFAGLTPDADAQRQYARVEAVISESANYDPTKPVEDEANPRYEVTYTITYLDKNGNPLAGVTPVPVTESFLKFEGTQENKNYYLAIPFELDAMTNELGVASNTVHFLYPNIYFLCVQPVFGNNVSSYSNFDSMTLDDVSGMELTPAQNLEVTGVTTTSKSLGDEKNEVSADLAFTLPGAKLQDYIKNSFKMNTDEDELKMNYNIYISTNESLLVSEFGKLEIPPGKTRMEVREAFVETDGAIFPYDEKYGEDVFYLSDTGEEGIEVMRGASGTALNELRGGGIVMLKDMPLSEEDITRIIEEGTTLPVEITLDGLDKNQKYYVYVDLELSFIPGGDVDEIMEKDAILSNAVSFTTAADVIVPGEDEKKPSSPILSKKDISIDQATIYWPKLSALPIAGETIEYDIVRLRNVAMDSDMLEHDGHIDTFLAEIPAGTERKVFRVDIKNGKLITYENGADKDTPADEYELDTENNDIEVTDISLLPNQIYYYYVRTIRTVETAGGPSTQYSTWNYISVTTTPISEPINLEVDRSDRTAYDPFTEAILAFDAPIENMSNLGGDYNIQYSVKKEGEDWSEPVTMEVSRLVDSPSLTEGYTHFRYKLTGLEPSTAYSFMVRMIDKNNDASIYSNIASTRTEYDQDGAEEERERNQWVQELQRQLRELLKQPYWYTADSSRTLSAIYRPTMFDALLWAEVDSQLSLVGSARGAAEFNYYIPASAIMTADAASKGFSFEHEGLRITIPALSFGQDANDTLKSVAADIKEGRIEDYYVRVSVGRDSISKIDGKDALTDEITVSFEAYGSVEDNTSFDKRIFTLLDAMVESDEVLDKAEAQIERLLSRDSESEEILAYIAEYVQEVRTDMMKETEDEFESIERRSQEIDSISGTYIISVTAPNAQATVEGFRREAGAWVAQTTMPFGAGHAIYTALAGSFAFAATVVDIAGLERLPYYNELAEVIGKYGLMDYIGEDVDVNGFATGQMVAGVVSRITGAPKGTDPYSFLSSKGLSVSNRTQFNSVSNQESLYMLMYIYENKTNTKVSTLTIRNFGVSAGVTALDERYKKSVQAALQEGISAKTNMNAAEKMTVSDLLETLSRLNQKVRL